MDSFLRRLVVGRSGWPHASAAGMDGVERELDPGEPHNVNFYALSSQAISDLGVATLPQTLQEAVAALEADPLFARTLGAEIIAEFIALKKNEWAEYNRHVGQWETDRYLSFF